MFVGLVGRLLMSGVWSVMQGGGRRSNLVFVQYDRERLGPDTIHAGHR